MTGSFDGFSVLEPADPAEIGRYQLYARLGAGGMGRVYLSALPGGRPVALKVVHDGLAADPEFRRRFALEARAAQQVNGIHIAQLLDVGADDPIPWLATAYIPGPSLLEAVRLHGPLPVQTVRMLTAGIARALDAIHQAGLVHRDLKPANVILAEDGPRVIDFGVARAADSTTGLTGGRIGSPQYMAPEQVRGQSATPALDVFALGALTFFAATGRPAFGEGEELAVLFRIVQEEPDLGECPQVVRDLVAACLAKDPERRPDLATVIRYCEGDATVAGSGWLPAGVADMTRARAASSTTLLTQAPTVRNGGASQGALGAQAAGLAGAAAGSAGSGAPAAFGPPANPGPAPYPPAATEVPPRPKTGTWSTGKVVGLAAAAAALSAVAVIGANAMSTSSNDHGTSNPPAAQSSNAAVGVVAGSSSSSGTNPTATAPSTGGGTTSASSSAGSTDVSGSSATPSAPANTSGPLTSGNDPVAWQGQLVFGSVGIDLGKDNFTYPTDGFEDLGLNVQVHEPAGQFQLDHIAPAGTIAMWAGSNAPTRQDCIDTLNSSGSMFATTEIGNLVCVKGQNFHVAVARIIAVDTTKNQVTAKLVLWTQAMQ